MAQNSEVLRTSANPGALVIFPESDIKHPM